MLTSPSALLQRASLLVKAVVMQPKLKALIHLSFMDKPAYRLWLRANCSLLIDNSGCKWVKPIKTQENIFLGFILQSESLQ